MTITILIPFLVCIAGALIYALSTNQKLQEIGRIMFAFGLFVTLLTVAQQKFHF